MSRSRTKPKKMKKKNPTENRSATEMNRIVVTLDDLPELPFEKVLSYLSLEDRLKARAVSRRWYHLINIFKVKTLCYSERPAGFIYGKGRWVSGAYAQNFISSPRFDLFVNTFGHSILSNLKHLCICHLNEASPFIPTLKLFGQLQELNIINSSHPSADSGLDGEFELNLPMLASIHVQGVKGIKQLTLDAPKLKRVKHLYCILRLEFVHADSVEWLATSSLEHLPAKNLKSLKYLHCDPSSEIDATFLSDLEQLKEVHMQEKDWISRLFDQKQRFGRADLKIFLCGCLLNGPNDPAIDFSEYFEELFVHLAKDPSRLADEIPFWNGLADSIVNSVSLGSAINILSKFTDLNEIFIYSSIPAQDVQRFLDLLKNVPNIVTLEFSYDQPQDLFDRLPEHSNVQHLIIYSPVSDFRFLSRLKHLIDFECRDQINTEVVRKAFEELPFLSRLQFKHLDKQVEIVKDLTNHWTVSIVREQTNVADLNAAIKLIFG